MRLRRQWRIGSKGFEGYLWYEAWICEQHSDLNLRRNCRFFESREGSADTVEYKLSRKKMNDLRNEFYVIMMVTLACRAKTPCTSKSFNNHHPNQNTTMPLLTPRRAVLLLCTLAACVYAEKHSSSIAAMSMPEIESQLQVRVSRSRAHFVHF